MICADLRRKYFYHTGGVGVPRTVWQVDSDRIEKLVVDVLDLSLDRTCKTFKTTATRKKASCKQIYRFELSLLVAMPDQN